MSLTLDALWRDVQVAFLQEAIQQLFNRFKDGLKNGRREAVLRALLNVVVASLAYAGNLTKSDTRCDVVNVLADRVRNMIPKFKCQLPCCSPRVFNLLAAGNVRAACLRVRVEVILGVKKFLELAGVSVELNPLLVLRVRDTSRGDARRLEPGTNVVHALLAGCKKIMHLSCTHVLAVTSRVRIRPSSRCQHAEGDIDIRISVGDLHLHEKLMAIVQIVLHQSDSDGQIRSCIKSLLFNPRFWDEITTFVHFVTGGGSSQRSGS